MTTQALTSPRFTLPNSGFSRLTSADGVSIVCEFTRQGPVVEVRHREPDKKVEIRSLVRASLIAMLVIEGQETANRWVSARVLRRSIWGRRASISLMHTTLYRIRASLRKADIPAEIIEADEGLVRLAPPDAPAQRIAAIDRFNQALASIRSGEPGADAHLQQAAHEVAALKGLWIRAEDL